MDSMKGKNITILLIDDNPLIMDLNRRVLTECGYKVLEAETISEGRVLFENETPDLIIMEVNLPDGSGLDFCKELRSHSETPVIFVSTLGTADDEVAGFEAGCNGYIPKPYKPHMLVVRMEALLRFLKRRESIALERAWEAARQNRDIEENGNAL